MGVIRVVLVDDQELVRTGFRLVLGGQPDLEVVGEAGDGAEAIEVVGQTRPDVVVMDVRMPRMDGVEATRRIRSSADAPRVLILTTFDLDEYVYEAIRAGASGFLLKDTGARNLIDAIRIVHSRRRGRRAEHHPAAVRPVRHPGRPAAPAGAAGGAGRAR